MLKKIKEGITQLEPGAKIILYGSYARGEAREDSDVDILVLLPDSYEGLEYTRMSLAISALAFDLGLEHEVEISPIVTIPKVYYKRKTPFTVNVSNEGVVL